MKVLENKFVEDVKEAAQPVYPKEDKCEYCGSTFEYGKEDVSYGAFGCGYVVCPCCGKETFLDAEGIDLTVDNLEFPKYYSHTSVEDGAVDISDEEIDNVVRRGIEWLRNNKDEFTYMYQCGTINVSIYRLSDGDYEYTVIVSKDFYETSIPFAPEDY